MVQRDLLSLDTENRLLREQVSELKGALRRVLDLADQQRSLPQTRLDQHRFGRLLNGRDGLSKQVQQLTDSHHELEGTISQLQNDVERLSQANSELSYSLQSSNAAQSTQRLMGTRVPPLSVTPLTVLPSPHTTQQGPTQRLSEKILTINREIESKARDCVACQAKITPQPPVPEPITELTSKASTRVHQVQYTDWRFDSHRANLTDDELRTEIAKLAAVLGQRPRGNDGSSGKDEQTDVYGRCFERLHGGKTAQDLWPTRNPALRDQRGTLFYPPNCAPPVKIA